MALTVPPAPGVHTAQQFQFADFTLDIARFRLERGDRVLRLEKLPMELLILLLERPGELVSREQIAERLWGKDVFVDVDHSINTAIRKIRLVLRDDPDRPLFLETVVGKGYRFAAPVTAKTSSNGDLPKAVTSAPLVATLDGSSAQAAATSVHASRAELDTWARSRNLRALQENENGNDASSLNAPAASERLATPISRFNWRFGLPLAVVGIALAIGASLWIRNSEYFWRSPIAGARFQTVTDFGGTEQAAALSRDGHFVAFLSDRDGQVDVWVTQVGSGEFHNLTRGNAPELVNPSLRTLGFSPDGSLVTYWVRKHDASSDGDIGIWAVPTLGGEPRPYLEGVAEFDWSQDGSRLAYHTPGPGDPLFVSAGSPRPNAPPIFAAPAGLHTHFPLWAPDSAFIYFVHGSLPDKLDIWRIRPSSGTPERITFHNGNVTYPILVDRRTLLYLAGDADGSGPWLYSTDVERRIPHRLSPGLDRYTSLAGSADGRRLVATLSTPKRTLWRLRIADSPVELSAPVPISLTSSTGFSPHLGPNFLLYVSASGDHESIWKLANGTSTELWNRPGGRIFGGPAISADGRYIAFSVREHGQTFLYAMQVDGTNARVATDSLDLQGAPAWEPDNQSIISAANDRGIPHLFRVPLNGHSPTSFVGEYSVDPAWAPDGRFVTYSGPDIGTTFSVKAVTPEATPYPLPNLTLTRGARHLAFLPKGQGLLLLRGEIQHKNLWLIDLATGAERQLTNFNSDFDIRDFDVSPDGREVVLERVQEHSDVVLLDLPKQ